jgi:hypothetical protein
MLNMLIYRKFEFVKSLYFVKGPSPDKVKGREVKEEFS